jgi:hypothetical protein
MFIELVDSLRCVEPHEDSWLVLATRRVSGRWVIEGTLGCPVCQRTYPIAGGVAYIGAAPGEPPLDGAVDAGPLPDGEDAALRLAALLGLASPGGLVVLGGAWGRYASAILDLVPVRLLLLDPIGHAPAGLPETGEGVSVVRTGGEAVPLAAGSARAVALDREGGSEARLAAAARALAAGGRLVGPTRAALPAGVRELARDDALWVAERERATAASAGAPVSLRRARRD